MQRHYALPAAGGAGTLAGFVLRELGRLALTPAQGPLIAEVPAHLAECSETFTTLFDSSTKEVRFFLLGLSAGLLLDVVIVLRRAWWLLIKRLERSLHL